MRGISSKALAFGKENRNKFNGGVELESDLGLDCYKTFFRLYDAQIGRFTGVDILAEYYDDITPYQFGGNNPIMFNDPTGALMESSKGRMQKGPDGNYHVAWLSKILWNNFGFFDWGNEGGGEGGGGGGGNYTHITGISSAYVLSQMNFGEKLVKNKSGEFGFWRDYIFNPGSEASGNVLAGVGVGVAWVSLRGFNSGNLYEGKYQQLPPTNKYLCTARGISENEILTSVIMDPVRVEKPIVTWNDGGRTATRTTTVYNMYKNYQIISNKSALCVWSWSSVLYTVYSDGTNPRLTTRSHRKSVVITFE